MIWRLPRSGTPPCWASIRTSYARSTDRPRTSSSGLGDYQHEVGIIVSRYAPHRPATEPAGAVVFWHVDDVSASLERLLSMGAREHEPRTDSEAQFVTASVVDPFGNILGIMHNPHFLEVLAR